MKDIEDTALKYEFELMERKTEANRFLGERLKPLLSQGEHALVEVDKVVQLLYRIRVCQKSTALLELLQELALTSQRVSVAFGDLSLSAMMDLKDRDGFNRLVAVAFIADAEKETRECEERIKSRKKEED